MPDQPVLDNTVSKPLPPRVPVMALPTPPRTKPSRKRKRVTSPPPSLDFSDPSLDTSQKKRKVLRLDALAAELSGHPPSLDPAAAEDAFWADSSSISAPPPRPSAALRSDQDNPEHKPRSSSRGRTLSRSPTRSPSSSPPARLLRRNNTGLFSPPPSRGLPTHAVTRHVSPPSLPRTPKKTRSSVRRKLFPERDSPNNPFLVSDHTADNPQPGPSGSEFRTPPPMEYVEKPTISYVFRGVKAEFENPLYDPSHPGRVPSPEPASPSQLPTSHPDFSPTMYCPPKLLFPEARGKDHARVRKYKSKKPELDGTPAGVPPAPEDSATDSHERQPPSTPKRSTTPRPRSQPTAKSEWDTSDEEEGAQSSSRPRRTRQRELGGVKPRLPIDARPNVKSGRSQDNVLAVEDRPKPARKDLQRLAKVAPLLLDAVAGKR